MLEKKASEASKTISAGTKNVPGPSAASSWDSGGQQAAFASTGSYALPSSPDEAKGIAALNTNILAQQTPSRNHKLSTYL